MQCRLTLCLCVILAQSGGCRSDPTDLTPNKAQNPNRATAQPVAYLNGQAISNRDLVDPLYEAAGGRILQQIVLGLLIDEQRAQRGLVLEQDRIDAESKLLAQTLAPNDPDRAADLLNVLRRRRGLGPKRFAALLRQNAALRWLIADQVHITNAALQQAYQQQYGPRYRGRLLVTSTATQAATLARQIQDGESFGDLAAQHSTDASAGRGGLLEPISPADPTYPKAIRNAITRLQPGQTSGVIAIDDGFALFKLEEISQLDNINFNDVKSPLRSQVQRRTEWMLMQQKAAALLQQAKIVILDPTLKESWDKQQTHEDQ
jgi:hypothetical protein